MQSQGIGALQQAPTSGSGYLILASPDRSLLPGWTGSPGSPPAGRSLRVSRGDPQREANTMQGLQGDLPQALLRLFETLTEATPCKARKASSWPSLPRPRSSLAFAANAFARSWHVKHGRSGVGGEVIEGHPPSGKQLLSLTRQSSFASSWVPSLESAAFSHGRRLRSCTPPKGQSTLRRTSTGV